MAAFNTMARELKITKDEIEEKRRYIEVILDNVATGIISTDKRGGILLLNRAAKDILGIERDVPLGTPIKEVFGGEIGSILKSFLREIRATEGRSVTQELKLKLKKDVTYIRASLTVLKDETDKAEGFILAFDDITHVVRAEKLATWREVARKMTHEIKNPLTPILLSAERIRRKLLPQAEEAAKRVSSMRPTSVIIRSVEDIKGIVNELTKLTRTSQAKTLEDINSVVDETITLYRHLYQNISFAKETGATPPFKLDRDAIKRALINLITNSVKALGSEGGVITVTTRYDRTTKDGHHRGGGHRQGHPRRRQGTVSRSLFYEG